MLARCDSFIPASRVGSSARDTRCSENSLPKPRMACRSPVQNHTVNADIRCHRCSRLQAHSTGNGTDLLALFDAIVAAVIADHVLVAEPRSRVTNLQTAQTSETIGNAAHKLRTPRRRTTSAGTTGVPWTTTTRLMSAATSSM